ncbi:MAG: PQQ-like beta-propeller repeat protein [Ignavibacteriae bacterium]|nr:PQQ-like beta-propeller repeat protein [Ignavibacteria bacterium]MBI3364393.1 PQQ-like beta-propeller repeat protein [Ignavibacteriota bacterium]
MRRQLCTILSTIVGLVAASCSYIKLQQVPATTADDWIMYGGTIERTNVAKTVVKPPLALVWEYDASAGFSPYSAAIAESLLFIGNLQGEVHIVHAATGKGIGAYDFGSAIVGTPVIDGSTMYVALTREEENLISYNLTNGAIAWKKKIDDIETSPLLVGKRLYLTTLQGKLMCVEKHNGETAWTYEVPVNARTRMIRSSPASDSSIVVFGCDDGNIYAVGIENGRLRWTAQTGASVVASPSIRNGKVFVGSLDRNFYAFDVSTGKLIWKQSLGGMIYASQAIGEHSVYVGTAGRNVYCLDAETGGIVWKATTNDVINAAPLLSGDALYVGSIDKTLYAYDATTGDVLWKYAVDGRIKTMPIASKHFLFVLVEDRTVMAFRHSEGK